MSSREIQSTAYTLGQGRWAIRSNFFATGAEEVGASLGLDFGVGHGIQVGLNALHMSAGLINLRSKWKLLERGPWALSMEIAPTWIHGNWVWFASNSETVSGLDAIVLPVGLTTSYRPTTRWQFDLKVHVVDVEIFGKIESESFLIDTQLALRQLSLTPSVRLHLQDRLSLSLSARLPIWARLPGAIEAEVELLPGVVAGGRSAGTYRPQFSDLYVLTLGARSIITKGWFVDFALNYGAVARRLYGNALFPKLGVEYRFF